MKERIGSTDNVTCYRCGYVLPMDLYMNIRTCPNCSPPLPTLQQRLERAREEIATRQETELTIAEATKVAHNLLASLPKSIKKNQYKGLI